ncbi:hypothetical protein CRE_07638 [Caenorhabditis remanei]|uniref:Uncharacterized protein n=1 Tax=Caenorhabditis remanei TaxID=31234 RepID=E3MPC4_CAERE|nr:hypothetical protein CRE_07638 [Caenorhabditis remanei]
MKLVFSLVFIAILGFSSLEAQSDSKLNVEKRFWLPADWYSGNLPGPASVKTFDAELDINQEDMLHEIEEQAVKEDSSENMNIAKRLYIERGGFHPEKRASVYGKGRVHPHKSIYAQLRLRGK